MSNTSSDLKTYFTQEPLLSSRKIISEAIRYYAPGQNLYTPCKEGFLIVWKDRKGRVWSRFRSDVDAAKFPSKKNATLEFDPKTENKSAAVKRIRIVATTK